MDGMAAGPPHRLQKCSNSVVGSLIICCRRDVRYWHKADIPLCTAHVRYWGKSGHDVLHCTCLLLTQSGHSDLQTSIFSLAILTKDTEPIKLGTTC